MRITDEAWVISDFHFGHENIINYCGRPFSNVLEMNNRMIESFNTLVDKDDVVINLGDFAFNDDRADCKHTLSELNGRHILVMGNHDKRHSKSFWEGVGFTDVYEYPIIYDDFYILSHAPVWVSEYTPMVNIHGHLHEKKYANSHYFNVCVEQLDYKPIRMRDIRAMFIVG
jgi:calcineurin-like phosphoesterase family protein